MMTEAARIQSISRTGFGQARDLVTICPILKAAQEDVRTVLGPCLLQHLVLHFQEPVR